MKLRARAKIEEVVAEELARRVARGDFRAGLVGLSCICGNSVVGYTKYLHYSCLRKAYEGVHEHIDSRTSHEFTT